MTHPCSFNYAGPSRGGGKKIEFLPNGYWKKFGAGTQGRRLDVLPPNEGNIIIREIPSDVALIISERRPADQPFSTSIIEWWRRSARETD
ncbi:Hypothetical protein NTJ_12416 [Nesidiocoris tenuis]|uniref:Uncharacterized protein n=1 Tax=Nesidiocoris tenuis TaxID=355587 RepID=A0ABN7B7I8_9HEMI|nr:Hypothetical protein NTJ_12416 [Nesidiocoris tenuis]